MHEKKMQKALLRWGDPEQRPLVEEALRRTGRLRPGERLKTRGVPWKRNAGWRPAPGPGRAGRIAGRTRRPT
jgi:hypothetical protein